MAQGDPLAALPFLTTAHSLDRENSEYELELASAMTAAGKLALAEPLLDDVLERRPNGGPANLIAARWRAQAGRMAEAEAHYHRAIYGAWPVKQQDASRLAARLELADLLARNGQKQELTGELISLQASAAPSDIPIQKRLASLYLVADAPERAADVYRMLVKKDPSDAVAYEGLGEAELQEGNYSAAGQAFFRAMTRDPRNQTARQRVLILAAVTGLYPTPRSLTSAEKYRRDSGPRTHAHGS